ncbi:unnamed protein product [Effrenium voratum]|nr:unnamed protein product [Effrenium voratum]
MCFTCYMQGRINEKRVKDLRCPLYGNDNCKAVAKEEELRQLLPKASFEKYQRFTAMCEDNTLRECPYCASLVKPQMKMEDPESQETVDPAMCCESGHRFCYLKLIDFGIAKKLDEGKTRTFTMIGTPHYMAPEIMRGHGYGTEVDLWSLGVILFEFVCGYLPFADELDDPTEVCTAVLKDPLEFPARFKDAQCKAVIQGLLNRQPKKRLGAGMNGWEDIRNCEFFLIGHNSTTLFDKIMGRELEAPVMPKGEKYCEPTDVDFTLSDEAELG